MNALELKTWKIVAQSQTIARAWAMICASSNLLDARIIILINMNKIMEVKLTFPVEYPETLIYIGCFGRKAH